MRYRCVLVEPDGSVSQNDYIEQGSQRYNDDDAHILARVGLHTLQFNFERGQKVILGPIEYECILCGEYSHSEATCPEACDLDTDDPFDEADYEEPVD